MAHLIDKSAVLAEIDKVMADEMKFYETACKEGDEEVSSSPMVYTRLQILRSCIDTLEVKEVDLEKEIIEECPFRKVGCERYKGHILECEGACGWIVDHPKLNELKTHKGK